MTDKSELIAKLNEVRAWAPSGSIWRHRGGNAYVAVDVAFAESSLEPVIIYRDADAPDLIWSRVATEFLDGRFTKMEPSVPDQCPDCGRQKAKTAHDAAAGMCPKWWAIRDADAARDCEVAALKPEGGA